MLLGLVRQHHEPGQNMFAQLQLQNGKRGIHYFPAYDTCGDGARGREERGCHALVGAHTLFGSSRVMPHS